LLLLLPPPSPPPPLFTLNHHQDYFDVLQTCFDFPLIRQLLSRQNFKLKFDAMNAVTGPYARELFDSILSSGGGSCCVNATPLPDFGGSLSDPAQTTKP